MLSMFIEIRCILKYVFGVGGALSKVRLLYIITKGEFGLGLYMFLRSTELFGQGSPEKRSFWRMKFVWVDEKSMIVRWRGWLFIPSYESIRVGFLKVTGGFRKLPMEFSSVMRGPPLLDLPLSKAQCRGYFGPTTLSLIEYVGWMYLKSIFVVVSFTN